MTGPRAMPSLPRLVVPATVLVLACALPLQSRFAFAQASGPQTPVAQVPLLPPPASSPGAIPPAPSSPVFQLPAEAGSPSTRPAQSLPAPAQPMADEADAGPGDDAYAAYQRGAFLTAFQKATRRLEGDPDDGAAMTLIGVLHAQGAGVAQDAAKAAQWFRLGAQRGDRNAAFAYAMALIRGEGVARDTQAGRALLEETAAAGHAFANANLGFLLLQSRDPADLARAAAALRIAADAEIAEAQYAYAVLAREGRGMTADRAVTAAYLEKGALNGDLPALTEFAIVLFNGDGIARDESRAVRLLKRAALRGSAIAQNRLARLHLAGRAVERDLVEAAAWHLMAAQQGLADAQIDAELRRLTEAERARAEALAVERTPR